MRPTFASSIAAALLIVFGGAALGLIANAAAPKGIPVVTPPLPAAAPEISFEDAWAAFDDGSAVFIDSRPMEEYRDGHIAGALCVPYDDRKDHVESLRREVPRDRQVIAYCDAADECESSKRLSGWLLIQGWKDVRYFAEGYAAWRDAGLPVTEGEQP